MEDFSDMTDRVAVVGGGLAGLAAAVAIAQLGGRVTVFESRSRAGGRASSFGDAASGQLVDTCQHVSMGCCTNLAHFCRCVGIAHFIRPQPVLYFLTPDRRLSRFSADPLPVPFHLARSFLRAHHLTYGEKLRIGRALARLRALPADTDGPFSAWLERHGQTPRCIERFWGLVLMSCLNEEVERVGTRYARKVFVDGFLRHRRGFEVQLPTVPLGRLYGDELQSWFADHDVRLLLNRGVGRLRTDGDRITALEMRDGTSVEADWYVLAVPFDRLLDLLPEEWVSRHACFSNLKNLETSPITSIHVWFDRAVTELPHAVLVGCQGQWVFNRGEVAPGEHYLQVVVSAARAFRGMSHDEVLRRIVAELRGVFPEAAAAKLLRSRVVTEHAATFSAVPGVDRWRPSQATPIPNLFLAGDWTQTGWPATMEGAVRSGYLAAEALLARRGMPAKLLQPDL
jgi:squalene-associated FAD-dependent desaturase